MILAVIAGNILGEEQSGHIKEVGISLYQHMLEEEIARQKAIEEARLAEEARIRAEEEAKLRAEEAARAAAAAEDGG